MLKVPNASPSLHNPNLLLFTFGFYLGKVFRMLGVEVWLFSVYFWGR